MSYRLLPKQVYLTKQTNLGIMVFQPVNGDTQLYGSNVVKYHVNKLTGKKTLIKPKFEELIKITDDLLPVNTVHPMNNLTTWIAFDSEAENAEIWCTHGIDESVTPTFVSKDGRVGDKKEKELLLEEEALRQKAWELELEKERNQIEDPKYPLKREDIRNYIDEDGNIVDD